MWNKKTKKSNSIYMHKLILNTPQKLQTDHIDRNKLNNQRNNLRTSTPAENQHNSKKSIRNKSGYKGVTWNKANKK